MNVPFELPITIDTATCRDFDRSTHLEWLEANGTGGFAMGTVAGVNTRRYHSLLLSSLQPPVRRYVFLSRVEDTVVLESGEVPLATAQYPGTVALQGYRHLTRFRLDPFPIWRWEWPGGWIEKQLFLVYGQQTTIVQYTCSAEVKLRVRPLFAFRDYHSLGHANDQWNQKLEWGERRFRIKPYDALPALDFHYSDGTWQGDGHWYRQNECLEELARGQDFEEDLFSPGELTLVLKPDQPAYFAATLDQQAVFTQQRITELAEAERKRRAVTVEEPTIHQLRIAADQFIVRRADGRTTIIAGYPWFADWGRDSMISMPGLLISRGKLQETRDLLEGFLKYLKQGLIPNRFPDSGEEPEYNTVDATLWMFYAVHYYLLAQGDRGFLKDVFYPAAKEILHWHEAGTLHGIGVDQADGLLAASDPGQQLTWMDAKVDDWVVTPRQGKPVEINALWYNALMLTGDWAELLDDQPYADDCRAKAARALESFRAQFWNAGKNRLYDVLTAKGPDASMRPNQIFAVSLPYPLLEPAQQQAVVKAVERDLLTPTGLRTLAPYEPDYCPHYTGGRKERDGAYHQGTAWPWLLGPYIGAYLRAFGKSPETIAYCHTVLEGIQQSFKAAGLGSLSEICDAEAPYTPRGCPAQAWSVGELLRVLTFDLGPLEDGNTLLKTGSV